MKLRNIHDECSVLTDFDLTDSVRAISIQPDGVQFAALVKGLSGYEQAGVCIRTPEELSRLVASLGWALDEWEQMLARKKVQDAMGAGQGARPLAGPVTA